MGETLDYLRTFAQFPLSLQRFMRHRLTIDEARQIVRDRIEHREENFLNIAKRNIYGYSRSPYLPLLQVAGCTFGDLQNLVKDKGLESALRHLREAGVYVSFEEFKGRKPIERFGKTWNVSAQAFDNPSTQQLLKGETGGSTGSAAQVGQDLEYIRDRAPHIALANFAYGTHNIPFVLWRGILPDVGSLTTLMRRTYSGMPITAWYSHLGLRDSKHWVKYGLATYYMVLWMRLLGKTIPWPQYASPQQADVVAKHVAQLRDKHGYCLLSAQTSRALRVALAAETFGFDLKGVTITSGGEAATPAKVQAIQRSGARFFSNYSMHEAGTLGFSCATAADPGDIHFFHDVHVLFTHSHYLNDFDLTVPAIHLTTLLSTAPKILFNLQIDDYGTVEQCSCGCAFEAYGYTTHLAGIRSYHKLTGEGVTLIGTDMVRVLEEVLPSRFGGSPLDYQLSEQEDEQGFTRLYLVIHPQVLISDDQAVINTVLNVLRHSSGMADAARSVWQKAETIRIKRAEPVWTARGKFMPLHLERNTKIH
jgi:hypothetical protein